jgi:hypothetical protein
MLAWMARDSGAVPARFYYGDGAMTLVKIIKGDIVMKHTTTLSNLALILAAGSFALVGGCGKSEQSASIEQTGSEVVTLESQQPSAEQAPADAEQAAASTESAESDAQSPATVAGETE